MAKIAGNVKFVDDLQQAGTWAPGKKLYPSVI